MRIILTLPFLMLALFASAQVPIADAGLGLVNRLMDAGPTHATLKCSLDKRPPVMDFAFRFDARYLISCPIYQFEPGAKLSVYLRITPATGDPVILGESYQVRSVPPELAARMRPSDLKKLELQASGSVALGAGNYTAELIVVDSTDRTFFGRWALQATPKGHERDIPMTLQPNTVLPTMFVPWNGKPPEKSADLRLTVLLHAVPMNPSAAKLYAWDRIFLLETLFSLLRQTPYKSIRLVAFNLDQQRELFRDEQFGVRSLNKLEQSLQDAEMATVSYRALQGKGWSELLTKLTQEELKSKHPSDAVIFLGPSSRFGDRIPKGTLGSLETDGRPFFYFEYYPWFLKGREFPDAIHYLTKDLHGTVFPIHTAPELAVSIHKMLTQLKHSDKTAAIGSPPLPGK